MHEVILNWESTTDSGSTAVPLDIQSPWCSFLGEWALPGKGAIDQLDDVLRDHSLKHVSLHGCPSASLLILIWVRSIWGRDRDTTLDVTWEALDPSLREDQTRAAAARLACLLADKVDGDGADAIGFQHGDHHSPEEAIDLISYLMDSWDPNLRLAVLGQDWNSMMQRTLIQCAINGHRRIGIYGAGTHTRSIGDALMAPESEICCIIDDDHRRHGEQLWGFPIVSPDDALQLNLDAVVLSANSIEDMLWNQASHFRDAGIETIKIYGQNKDDG